MYSNLEASIAVQADIGKVEMVYLAPGQRTSGTQAGHFGVVPPGWQGNIPAGVQKIQAPTPYVFLAGRTQVTDPSDFDAVHRIQDSYSLWMLLIFPAWVLLVSVYILITNLHPKEV